jgi:hypothetical protein
MELSYYKSKDGLFFQIESAKFILSCYRFNGLVPTATYHSKWKFLEGQTEIKEVTLLVKGRREKIGYKLKSELLEKMGSVSPHFLSLKDVEEVEVFEDDIDSYIEWKNSEYKSLQSMYVAEYKESEDSFENVEFIAKKISDIEYSLDGAPEEFIVKQCRGDFGGKTVDIDLSSVCEYSDLERMLVPEFLLHKRPCSLSSLQSYRIIRAYVKENINPKVAEITSDYDFCFDVSKKIKIKPYISSYEAKKLNGKSYRPPKNISITVRDKAYKVFEMTHSSRNYQNYTPIPGFKGDSLEDLHKNIKDYLDHLMYLINEPLEECPNCEGCGIVKIKE